MTRELGQGAYGYVWYGLNSNTSAAVNKISGQEVAVKKITKVFDKPIFARRALRELKLLKHFNGHENITSVFDMDLTDPISFNEIFLVQELMEADLHQIIRSEQSLTDAHYQYFVYQICRGLKYIHSSNVLHRDLKPGNLLVNADCELKICDFGLARGIATISDSQDPGFMTEYVATRSYSKAIDIWSVGCILAELLGGKPLFKGRDYVDQLSQILRVCGTPDEATISRIGSEKSQMYIKTLSYTPKVPFRKVYPNAPLDGADLLEKLLEFDPGSRINVEEALEHPYLAAYHDKDDEPSHDTIFDFSFESIESIAEMKSLIAAEITKYKMKQTRSATLTVDALAARNISPSPLEPDVGLDLEEELMSKKMSL